MGLAGRKIKQRIGSDPRNLSWADNAAKFGQEYLSKLGWNPSEGLGARGDGVVSHIKVAQKLNLLGIGAGSQQAGPESIAWKQNKEYEELLKRLNQASEQTIEANADAENTNVANVETEAGNGTSKKRKRSKKDKEETPRKKKKEDKKAKSKKMDESAELDDLISTTGDTTNSKSNEDEQSKLANAMSNSGTVSTPTTTYGPRPMAHRARFLASKRLVAKSSSAISEILGIAPSSSGSSATTPQYTSLLTAPIEPTELLTTSTISVADYFKERLAARSDTKLRQTLSTDVNDVDNREESTTRPGIGAKSSISALDAKLLEDADTSPRTGLGLSRLSFALGMSTVSSEPDPVVKEKKLKDKKKKKVTNDMAENTQQPETSEITHRAPDKVVVVTKKEKRVKKSAREMAYDVKMETEADEEKSLKKKKKHKKTKLEGL